MRLVRPGSLITQTWRTGHHHPARAMAATAVTAATALLLTGCNVLGTSSAAATPTATVTVTAMPGVADAPLYIAAHDGQFRNAGLKVRLVPEPTFNDEVAALRSGKADIAFGGYASLFYAQAQVTKQNLDMAIVAEGYDAGSNVMEVLTLPGSGIVSPSDLAGETIGTALPQNMPDRTGIANEPYAPGQPFSLATLATTSVLSNDEVKPSKSIRWDPMASSKLVAALGKGKVQAIVATEPTIYEAETRYGAVPVIDSCTGATANLPLAGYFSLRSYAAGHHAEIAAFRSALSQAKVSATQPGVVQSVLKSAAKMSPQEAALVTLGSYPTTTSISDLRRIITLMDFYNMLPPGQPDLAKMLDP